MQNLTWQYPSWYLLFCVLLGLGAAIFLYRRDSTFLDQPRILRTSMAVLRGVVVTVLSALLLAPLLKLLQTRTEPPVILIAQDQSTSIKDAMSKADSTAYVTSLNTLYDKLSKKYTVRRIGFGEEVKEVDQWKFADKASDMGEMMSYLQAQYRGENIGAVILATDGAYNRGKNPLYVSGDLKAPLSVIALGDTVRKTDLQVKDVFHNSIAYLSDKFKIQVDLSAIRLNGATTNLELKHVTDKQTKVLESQLVQIDGDPFFQTKEFTIEASESGVQHYRIQLSQVKNEVTYANNVRDFFVEVIDSRLKVLVLANSPHPDLAIFKNALLEQKNYEVDVKMAGEVGPDQLNKYDLVILHQLPSLKNPVQSILGELDKLNLSRVFVVGYQTDLNAFNHSQTLVRIDNPGNNAPNEVTMIYNPGFTTFKTSGELQTKLATFSPLLSPYGEYTPSPSAQILAYQRIGKVDTQFPLILMGETNDRRTCVITGEGLWKWQLYDQLQNGSKVITHELLNQLCQYTSTKSDKRKFRVSTPKKLFTELEEISFQAELYNDNYELINTPEVTLKIRNGEGEEFDYTFNTSGDEYALNIGRFPEGNYSYSARTELNGVKQNADGKFVIQPVQLEALSSTADHGLLRQLADQYGGKVVTPAQMETLGDDILNMDSIKPVLYSSTQTQPLIHLKWLCLILLAALSLEWFLRRYYGGY
ncbi:MAG TPA: hypothetical protein VFV79_01500 [Saprospiraceae bacterium]|nr:hypothetical protein [Saprospiraceae bacterium]